MYRFFLVLVIIITIPVLIVGFFFNACAFAFNVGSEMFDSLVEKA